MIAELPFVQPLGAVPTMRSLALTFFICLSSCVTAALGADARPNILFIMSDDHAYQSISAYGSKVNKTPNIDRIAQSGVRFDRCFVTNSICGPSRATILTGKYNHLNGFIDNTCRFDGEQPHVAKYLQSAGYETAVIGKWHLVTDPTGFNHWEILQGQGPYYNPALKTPNGIVRHEGYTTEIIAERTVQWLKKERNKEKPFYLMCHHKAAHREWLPGPKQVEHYKDVKIPEPETLFDDYSGRTSAAKNQEMSIAKDMSPLDLKFRLANNLTPAQMQILKDAYAEENAAFEKANLQGKELVQWRYQRYAKDYLRCVDALDDAVGRVLDTLEEEGLAENTLVIYTSDQGWYLGEHGWYDKRWMYEESFRTPCVMRWPGQIKPGSVNTDLCMNLDFAETFLDIAGEKIPADMQGRSLLPVLRGATPSDWRQEVYYHYYEYPAPHRVEPHYGVRTAKHKLIYFPRVNEWEFFDLEKDPRELKSMYNDPEYQTLVTDLKQRLIKLRKQYQDDDSLDQNKAAPGKKKPALS
jgi:arylsulfatase A-like enzyme